MLTMVNIAKTLIAYGTRFGATAEVAEVIAEILRKQFQLEVNVINLEEKYPKGDQLIQYSNIVIGSGIKVGKWVNRAKRFLGSNFEDKNIAVYVCSRRAGEPDLYEYAYERYIKKIIEKNLKIEPIAVEAFGGRKPLKDGEYYENRNWEKIREWAKEIGEIFSKSIS